MLAERARDIYHRAPPAIVRPGRVIARTIRLFTTDDCATYAAAIAYYAVFSFVPLTLMLISILGLVLERDQIVDFVFDQIPLRETEEVRADVDRLVGRALDFSWAGLSIGALTLVWAASGVFGGVRRGLHAAAHEKRHRPWWQSKLLDISLIPALGGLLIMGVWISSAVERLIEAGPIDLEWTLAVRVLTFAVAAGVAFTLFLILYRYVPAARPGWPEAICGALFATIAFEIVRQVWAIAAARVLRWDDAAVYAGLGYVAGAMLWIYINAIILLLGAEFGRALAIEWRETRATAVSAATLRAPQR